MQTEKLIKLQDELTSLCHRIIDDLAEALAESEECPYYTDEGCPRPTHKVGACNPDDPNCRCDKSTRRGTYGKECWKLWATLKSADRLASTITSSTTE